MMHFGEGWKALLGEWRAQVALTSEERPNGRANTVITEASLQGAACSESAAPEQACVLMYMRVFTRSCSWVQVC